ncbi:MAG TPA: hypothetical protein VNR51_03305, partial [Hyphomicrobium sp.]|nr:hypothetical protein [Hyphomicrobium sp.]
MATALFAGTPAFAQSPGSTCCSDLERRIEGLEARTATRGNRTVSLQISGLVNSAVMTWDDGRERNAYVVTNDNQRTRFSFVGKAAIDKTWEAGYALDIGVRTANSKLVNQFADRGFSSRPPNGFDLRSSAWFLRNKRYGTAFLGTTFAAT